VLSVEVECDNVQVKKKSVELIVIICVEIITV